MSLWHPLPVCERWDPSVSPTVKTNPLSVRSSPKPIPPKSTPGPNGTTFPRCAAPNQARPLGHFRSTRACPRGLPQGICVTLPAWHHPQNTSASAAITNESRLSSQPELQRAL